MSLPEDLADAVREHVGSNSFSAYITEALQQRLAMDKLGEIVADYTTDNAPISQEEIDAARTALRHDKNVPGQQPDARHSPALLRGLVQALQP